MTRFEIPPQYQDLLELIEPLDTRPEGDILKSLAQYAPVTSEKNIWAFWHSGVLEMPAWCQRNVLDWVKICGPSWTIRVVDNMPESPNYALNYVDEDLVCEAFTKGTMDGPYVGQHSADLVRGATLTQHGGVWMDVGTILIRHMDRICWDRIQDQDDPYKVAVAIQPNQGILNYFVACRKGDPFIRRWHEVFCALWVGRTNLLGISNHPLVSYIKQKPTDQIEKQKKGVDFNFKVPVIEVFEYAIQVVAWARLTKLDDAGDGFSCSNYWLNHIFGIDAVSETWPAEMLLGFNVGGQSKLDVLSTRLDANENSEQYKLAHKVIWQILCESSMQKISHGKDMSVSVQLGTLLDSPEHADKDHEPGTFAELLRYGTVHFRQKRLQIATRLPEAKGRPVKKGHLEPF
ncbi:hypothetical protein BX600DRAFT_487139 [Xylariales sp. PMI_506]|nr:hypothetical protein BX600DRAFT_487139 [Xylariales sp. PMI_506]